MREDPAAFRRRLGVGALALGMLVSPAQAFAQAKTPTVEDLQRQIDELKAQIRVLTQNQRAAAPAASVNQPAANQSAATIAPAPATTNQAPAPDAQVAATAPATPASPAQTATPAATPTAAPPVALAAANPPADKPWYARINVRGYTQLRLNEIISGDATAPDGVSRLRSPGDGGITDEGNFTFRRIRLVFSGDLSDSISFYFQPDFAVAVSNQSAGERREGFAQLRDAYVDWSPWADRRFRFRFGQQKVPFGWENLQSSSNRLTLDRSDGINSAIPGERDLGVTAFFTPAAVQRIWDRLEDDGQKLFGNYGAFGFGLYNGQGVNRPERNNDLMSVAMATWPFELDGLGTTFAGQVLEVGASGMRNRVRPEIRTGGVSDASFRDDRVGVHLILYPQPFGLQAEWNWGRGPEYDPLLGTIRTRSLSGGYVQAMGRVRQSPLGPFMPYVRWQTYRGGWKAIVNAPRLETDEIELGIEFQPIEELELTLAYADMTRREADERRFGRAEGDVIRAQLQWNY